MNGSNVKLMLIFGFLMAAFLFCSCDREKNPVTNDQITGSGRIVSESRTVGSFTGIQVTNFAKVFISQDTVESLRIESDDNIIGRVATSVNRGILVVGLRDGSYNDVTVSVYASMKNIKLLESTGAATFSSTNSFNTDSLTCRITGVGSMTLVGKTNYERIEITGSGDVHNSNFISSYCSISISGAGNVETQVTQQLDATIAGTGTITYFGNPAVIHQSVSGVGTIRQGH
jgi:hypothetical protein